MRDEKPVLFLDFDGLKFDTLDIHVRYINERYGIQTVPADYTTTPRLETVIKKYLPDDQHHLITGDAVYADIGENCNASLAWHAEVPPIDGMKEVLPLLAEKYRLWTVTARQKSCLHVIEHLLREHVPGCISGIHCVWERMPSGEFKGIPKRDFIASFDGRKVAFIDDSPTEIVRMQDLIPSYLFDPAGLNDDNAEIKHRLRSWKEIGETFL